MTQILPVTIFTIGIVLMIASIIIYFKIEENFNNRLSNILREIDKMKSNISKIEYAQTVPEKGLTLPSTINFTVVERRRVVKEEQGNTQQETVKKIKKQMRELSI